MRACYLCYSSFFFLMIRRPPRSTRTDTLFPYTTLFRSLPERILTLRRDEIGVVDQKDRDLALQILPLEIVPAAFGRADAVADEYHRRVRDDRAILGLERRDIDIGAEAQRRRGAFENGRCSWRERMWQYVVLSGGSG